MFIIEGSGNNVVVSSYYVIKMTDGMKVRYLSSSPNVDYKKLKFVRSEDKAYKYEYFGLVEMEKVLIDVYHRIFLLDSKGIKNLSIVGRDKTANILELEPNIRKNFLAWERRINADTIDKIISEMINISKDDDGESTDDYVSLYKFLSHIKSLDYFEIDRLIKRWKDTSLDEQYDLTFEYARGYSASRFLMFMDLMANKIKGSE